MSRLAALFAVLATTLALAPAAHAEKGVMLGIGEQHATMFDDPLFTWLGMKTARIVVPWDVMRMESDRERLRVWLDKTRLLGVQPLVAFGRSWDRRGHKQLPTLSQYRNAFMRFQEMHWDVDTFIPWNEPNHPKQPTWKKPEMAGRFYNAIRAECPACTIVAGDVLDTPGMTRYTERYRRVLKEEPKVWGMHNYGDAYGRKSTATRQMLRITKGELWLTETGGVVRRPRGRVGVSMKRRLRDAAGATRYVLRLAVALPRVTRVYLYQWREVSTAPWDSALLKANGRLRPAFRVAAQFLRRDVSSAPRALPLSAGASASAASSPRRCKSSDLRYPFQPGGPKYFGVFRLRIVAGGCTLARSIARRWMKRFEDEIEQGRVKLPRRVGGFRFVSLPVRQAQTYKLRGRRGDTTIRFLYRVPNG